jgi:hypothetical protein
MNLSINITALSFSVSAVLAGIIAWRSFYVWKKHQENRTPKLFFYFMLFSAIYMAIRGFISFFFANSPAILSWGYVLSHVFLVLAAAYLIRFAVANLSDTKKADKVFYIILLLFISDIILNIVFPNSPSFNKELNIIEWGTNDFVGIYHTALLWLVFLSAGILFIYKAVYNWHDREIRIRSLLIATGIILGIIIVIPRNVFHAPLFIVISDIGYVLSFGITLLGVSYHFPEKD